MARKILNGLDLNAKAISNLADGSANTDAVTKQQLDAAVRGLDWKQEVVAASTANVTVASPGTTLDGITLAANDRVLLKDQTTPAENGIYIWTASGSALTRALDADSGTELSGATVTVQRGTVNADRVYRVTADDPITVGTTAITLAQVGAGGASGYATIQANGSNLTQRTILNFGAGLAAVDNSGSTRTDVTIDTSVVARKFSADCVVTTNPQTFTHNLNTKDVNVSVRVAADDSIVEADVIAATVNTVSVNFGGAPTAAQYRVTVIG